MRRRTRRETNTHANNLTAERCPGRPSICRWVPVFWKQIYVLWGSWMGRSVGDLCHLLGKERAGDLSKLRSPVDLRMVKTDISQQWWFLLLSPLGVTPVPVLSYPSCSGLPLVFGLHNALPISSVPWKSSRVSLPYRYPYGSLWKMLWILRKFQGEHRVWSDQFSLDKGEWKLSEKASWRRWCSKDY